MTNRMVLWTLLILLLILGVSLNMYVYFNADRPDDSETGHRGNGMPLVGSGDAVLLTHSPDAFFVEDIKILSSGDYPLIVEGPEASSDVISTEIDVSYPGDIPFVALVMDDFGYSLSLAREVTGISIPITWSVLPGLSRSMETVEIARENNIPFLIHMPMQAFVDDVGGPYLVGEGMTYGDIRQRIREVVKIFPHAAGINNHRGSKATSDRAVMEAVMDELALSGTPFIDSRTSRTSVAYKTALEKGVPALYNGIFLDNEDSEDAIEKMFIRAKEIAERKGWVIAICHLKPATISFLKKLCINDDNEVEFVTVPELFKALRAE
ncbi:MAG: divergent polysaccharide deacetylase family protein [Synergistales bacterium]|nr:divergent polysaccharide deacetylase family protein [Synergistales bacterium]